ncbi:MAG: alanine/ornithine racemase family PLP-dependent enzyme [Candidatus Limnocylindrales bacterium]
MEVDLTKIEHNAVALVGALAARGIAVTGVTKATLGSSEIAKVWLRAGVTGLGDSRVENLRALRAASVTARLTLIRSPMITQVDAVVREADVSLNTEIEIIRHLSAAAARAERLHGVILMVELGDLREGIMPRDLEAIVLQTLRLPNLILYGIGANLACHSGVSPDATNMGELSGLADSVEARFGLELAIISGGNSGNLDWILSGADTARVNDLRLGESLLLGREPLHRRPLEGLHTDAITLVAEVIESGSKPSRPWGDVAERAFGSTERRVRHGITQQALLAVGEQDTDCAALLAPAGFEIIGASSDHLVLDCGNDLPPVGGEIRFGLGYSALVRAMTSPFVSQVTTAGQPVAGVRV